MIKLCKSQLTYLFTLCNKIDILVDPDVLVIYRFAHMNVTHVLFLDFNMHAYRGLIHSINQRFRNFYFFCSL